MRFDRWRGTMFLIFISGLLLLTIVFLTLPETKKNQRLQISYSF